MTQPERKHYGDERTQQHADTTARTHAPSYRTVLQEPTVLLAGNPIDRPDVATSAILGYN
jgi:hypothetical protein